MKNLIILVFLVAVDAGAYLTKNIESYTLTYGNSEYYVDTQFTGDYMAAIEYCIRMDMKLVSMESERELDAIYDWVTYNLPSTGETRSWWTSGSRLANDVDWIWHSTGQLVNAFGKWEGGQPDNNGGNQKCLRIDSNSTNIGYYDDMDCQSRFFAICEKRVGRN